MEGKSIFRKGGRGTGKIIFGGEGSELEEKQANSLAEQMMSSAELGMQLASERIHSIRFNEVEAHGTPNCYHINEFEMTLMSGERIVLKAHTPMVMEIFPRDSLQTQDV